MDWNSLWKAVLDQLTPERLAPALILTLVFALLKFLGVKILKNLRKVASAVIAVVLALPRYLSLLNFVRKAEKPIWEYRRFGKLELHNLPPIITVMNFKGGVGKTTIAANLAACLSLAHGKKVLLVDLDYQGSLSSELLPVGGGVQSLLNTTGKWLSSPRPPVDPQSDYITPEGLPNVRLLTADYDLSDIEDNQIQRWLLQDRTSGDVRSRLARYLRANRLKTDCDFDFIIMDAPPRLSLAAANAVRSSTMILIPTRLQYLASQPIAKMLDRLKKFKEKSGGQFSIGGVICNFAADRSRFTAKEQPYLENVVEALSDHPDEPIVFSTRVPDTPEIGSSDSRPAYLSNSTGPNAPSPIFDQLTIEILDRLRQISAGR